MSKDYKPFSERYGYRQSKLQQVESVDDVLRNCLWNAFYDSFPVCGGHRRYLHPIYLAIWREHSHNPADEYNGFQPHPRTFVRELFQKAEWFKVFDLIEFCLQALHGYAVSRVLTQAYPQSTRDQASRLEAECNRVLKEENSAYRIIEGLVAPITSEQEIEEIKTALQGRYGPANEHIQKALVLFSNRQNPDYKNSIKESICAVESIAKEVTGESKATLGKLTERLNLHPAFQDGLNKLYGFTSDASGIRHASYSDKDLKPDQNTARFMLVLCSSFVNYIISQNPK